MENLTPMLTQYAQVKSEHADCILFFRLGDFYEMFFDDAKVASNILDLVLTSRPAGRAGKVPMCGIPYHSADSYIARLVKAGRKVAICEQVEDPKDAKGIVRREVIRVITSGTFIDEDADQSRYVCAVYPHAHSFGFAFTDTTSGTIQVNQYLHPDKVVQLISKLPVYECVFPESQAERINELFDHPLLKAKDIMLSPYADWSFNVDIARKTLCEHFSTHNLSGFGIEEFPQGIASAGALLEYLKQMNRRAMVHLDRARVYNDSDYVIISGAAWQGLELDSFIKSLDHTCTAPGGRLLKEWVYHPLKSIEAIIQRQNAIVQLKEAPSSLQEKLTQYLHHIPDIERSLSRISCGCAQGKDLLALRNTFILIPQMRELLDPLVSVNELFFIEDIGELREELERAVNPEIPLAHPQGKIIRKGYNLELDGLRDIQENARQWLRELQRKEIEKTGINSLKIGYNKIFGYYIEISKSNLSRVPAEYIRKQTLVNAERFITPELKTFEEKMLTAQEEVLTLEEKLVARLHELLLGESQQIHRVSAQLATVDCLFSMSCVAQREGYTLPHMTDTFDIAIVSGRHPVIEKTLAQGFIPNDTRLDKSENHLLIITGPNMAGKSTYIRQVALLVIMAQIGSFIPAERAQIGIVDKIFTRIGARDDITKGQSTFMVEMNETAEILNNISARSLVILDEIGRGTSTYDGLSLAWAITEYLAARCVRTLFATHFHELTALNEEYPGVKNYNVAVKEWNDEVVFLHKIVPGGTDDSYGIYVAKLAGVPQEVVNRAQKILTRLEIYGNLQEKIRSRSKPVQQLSLFAPPADPVWEKMKKELRECDINSITPLAALHKVHQWKELIDTDEQSPHSTSSRNQ
ncbi:MAG: DNA mismatch repair protein MutS [Candidatus Omnitrophica bacterium]|nr:DNA mismatch repair protein MutS [Candidatus Omnitrophota bacterium]